MSIPVMLLCSPKILHFGAGGYVKATMNADCDNQMTSRSVLEDVFRALVSRWWSCWKSQPAPAPQGPVGQERVLVQQRFSHATDDYPATVPALRQDQDNVDMPARESTYSLQNEGSSCSTPSARNGTRNPRRALASQGLL